jgi:hypothetical protein
MPPNHCAERPLGAREHQLNVLYAASVAVVQRRCDPDWLNYLVGRTRGFNLIRLLVYNIKVRLIAAASMRCAVNGRLNTMSTSLRQRWRPPKIQCGNRPEERRLSAEDVEGIRWAGRTARCVNELPQAIDCGCLKAEKVD